MYNDPSSIEEAIENLNRVSPSFCMAKWMHATIHLHMGRTHSCYLPPTHQIPVRELKNNPSALHNTAYKKEQRRKMLEGKRPKECQICWDIEDLPERRYSDRHYRGQDCWIKPFLNDVANSHWNDDIDPTYLEVSFSSACNFKCSYCNPTFSTAWLQEVNQQGGYKLTGAFHYQAPLFLKAQNLMPLDDENNPYVRAFWEWWPTLRHKLMFFRITGGEPLLIPDTFKLLDHIIEEPLPHLELSLNSNMGVNEKQFQKFFERMDVIQKEKKVKHFMLHTSLDSYGRQAEYIRNGLQFGEFERRCVEYLERYPEASLSFTCTYNALSVVGFRDFMDWILSLRKRYSNDKRNIFIDIPHLQGPEHQSCLILTEDYHARILEDIRYLESREAEPCGVKPAETLKLRRIHEWIINHQPKSRSEKKNRDKHRADFYLFFTEHDRRRGTNFLQCFPEMNDFFQLCHSMV